MRKFSLLLFLTWPLFLLSCVKPPDLVQGDVVINEVLPVNKTIAPDQNGEYDDWIELYNLTSKDKDISGYYLSDTKRNLRKWRFPAGTVIPGNGFLIVWADNDTGQLGLHANFKLSSEGEEVCLMSADEDLLDDIKLPAQSEELSYSRNPDGTGYFKWQTPTFDSSNETGK